MGKESFVERRAMFPRFAAEIDTFYRREFRYKSSCVDPRFPTIGINRAAVDLYLRFNDSDIGPGKTVVIARIGFRAQRRGHGTRLLSKLVGMADRYGITSIGVEQTGSDPRIQNFVRKFGFRNHMNESNWIVSVDALRKCLEQVGAR